MSNSKSYHEMLQYHTFEERFEYLNLLGLPGTSTFGFERWMNQAFYTSAQWRQLRQHIIARDEGMDLGVPGFEIYNKILIHHINPMTPEDFEAGNPSMLDPDNLITTTHNTHNAIHFGDRSLLMLPPVERHAGDTRLW